MNAWVECTRPHVKCKCTEHERRIPKGLSVGSVKGTKAITDMREEIRVGFANIDTDPKPPFTRLDRSTTKVK
jgi:hypothetical protein